LLRQRRKEKKKRKKERENFQKRKSLDPEEKITINVSRETLNIAI